MKHLWLALKEGLIEHRRALLRVAAVALGVVVVIQGAFYFVSTDARVCGSCHIMTPYIKMWKTSSHKDVACVTCHSEWRWVISRAYVKYALGFYTTQLRAEVPDSRCLSCHEHQNLDTDKPFLQNIHFSHKNHLGEMRRGKRLHCTSCHSGLAMAGTTANTPHVSVVKEVCFICHFKGAEKGQAVTGCLVCHGPPTTVVSHQGFQFNHTSYLKRKVRCDLCHAEVTKGDANVPPERCSSCHVSRIEAYSDSERVHRIHLSQHEIDCQRCHNTMEHGEVAMVAALGERCENCHRPTHTPQEEMYIGIGGQGVPETPSTMFLARVACDSCHGEPGGDPRRGAAALRKSCVTCHGSGMDRMVDDWINEMGALTAEVGGTVSRADSAARGSAALQRAHHNLDFVRSARGEHNIRYAVELLRVTRDDAVKVLKGVGAPVPPPPAILASASGYCRVCHSTSHLGTSLPFAGMEYDHNRHLAMGLTCEKCHSIEEHGKTTITREACMACHHGKEQKRSCESCHSGQAAFYKGQLAGTDVKGDPDVMAQAEVTCDSCHDLSAPGPVVKAVQEACVTCHEKGYDEMLVEWINDDQKQVQELALLTTRGRAQVGRERGAVAQAHRRDLEAADRIYQELLRVKGVHNTALAGDAYDKAKKLLTWVAQPSQ
jgi:hypothetical protein